MKKFDTVSYKKYNNILGWITFAIAAFVYLSTIEPTASFWDCSEFIASGFKLEVGHPPGAPLFMLLVRLFTMFAPSNELVPVFANAFSALASAFTILFLFWTITHLAKKMVNTEDGSFSITQLIIILSTGFVGALTYTFSDTFWFSAVEGEVYATSSLFTALVFWAILKWENEADKPYSKRWIVLIAYLMGLSIGVHLLNLLAIPAIVLVYYFKNYNYTLKGFIGALALSALLVVTVMYGVIQGFVIVASKFELFFVNSIGLPFMSGVIIYIIVVAALLIYGLYYTYNKKKPILNTIFLSITVMLIGYSSYAAIVIRSQANPPMNQNCPDNMFSLLYYLNREQYGERPLLYGQSFSAQAVDRISGEPSYAPKGKKYVAVRKKSEYKYDSRFEMPLPRMYSDDPQHVSAYKTWTNFKGKPVSIRTQDGSEKTVFTPTFGENLEFLFRYQIGFMYLRYFMWNFAGKQNDIQGEGGSLKGNWICGIPIIDNPRLGPQDKLPDLYKNNKAHNKYYLLPLLLGLAGVIFQYKKSRQGFWVVLALFFMTGIAIVLYLNQTPYQPRERDYAYAGSFYAFSIWIGLGVMAVYELLKKIKDHQITAITTAAACTLMVPTLMAKENWNDHDRSNSYIPTDFGYNMLIGCKPDAILFTYGDNDTFPLWYNQEVEGVRTDVRVSNLSYLRGDWYIDQMKHKAYNSDPMPIRMTREQYYSGKRDVILVFNKIKEAINLDQAVNFMLTDNPEAEIQSPFDRSERINYLPGKTYFLPVNKSEIIANNLVPKYLDNQVLDTMIWSINKQMLLKDGQVILDLVATNKWKRPLYFGTTVSSQTYVGLNKFFHLDGLMYQILPVTAKNQWGVGSINTEELFDNLMHKYRFRSLDNPKVYIDENKSRIVSNYRSIFARLANGLIDEGKKDSAITAMDKCMEIIPENTVPLNYFALPLIEGYYRAGEIDKAVKYSEILANQCIDIANYILTDLDTYQQGWLYNETQLNLAILQELTRNAQTYEHGNHFKKLNNEFTRLVTMLEQQHD
ncbi:MAG TPA: DUF2723 domain-containing protein [Tenuifilaceae bacterium]|nr:DUF2723 domain-containing protein [Tenuifilaceae bacterium]